jgi:hypothetical protein
LTGTASININGTVGATTPAAGTFTTLSSTGNTTIGDAVADTVTVNGQFVNGTVLRSAQTATNTLALAAYDVDGAVYTNLVTLTASNTPTLALTSTGVGTINNMSVGATTASTGAFTTLSATGTATFSGNVSNTSSSFTRTATTQAWLDGSMTTGTWIVGGTTQTGAITLGRSTGAQTLNLATGATTATTTKTVNIGTAGVSTSVTNITSGSSVVGALVTHTWNAGANNMTLDSSGNLGIGNTAANVNDQVGAVRPLLVSKSDSATTIAGSQAAIVIGNSDTTTSNTSQLSFAAITGGSTTFFTSAAINCIFGARTNAQYPTGILTFSTSTSLNSAPTEKMRIANDGIVTMSAYGAGAATFSAAGVISSVSDETWKVKDGVPADVDSMLKKLEPGYWYYNDEKKQTFGVDRQLGFYAQNVNAAIGPEAAPIPETVISKAQDGTDIVTTKPWGYYDRSVLAVTVMSLQKALATIESLTLRIAVLEAK